MVAIPSQVFYEDGSEEGRHLVRWAFCKERDVLDEGIARLRAADLAPLTTRPAASPTRPRRVASRRRRAGGAGRRAVANQARGSAGENSAPMVDAHAIWCTIPTGKAIAPTSRTTPALAASRIRAQSGGAR